MIKLEIEDYCQECPDFEPDVEKPTIAFYDIDEPIYLTNTVIRCEYRDRCTTIKKHIESVINSKKE